MADFKDCIFAAMILLTGATGMLGSHIALELLRGGEQLRALCRPGSSKAAAEAVFSYYGASALFGKIAWADGDVMDVQSLEDAMQDVTHVVHAAALVSFDKADRDALWRMNGEGTANMVNAALSAGVQRFVHISSVAALGKTEDDAVVDEDSWWKNAPGNSHYAISKYNAEREVWRGTEEGLNAIILNPSFIVGPGDPKRSSNVVFPMAAKGINWYTEGITGYVDVRDVAAAVKWALSSTVSNERFVLNAENLSYRQFTTMLLNAFNKKPAAKLLKPWMTALAWRAEKLLAALSGRKPRLTKETAAVLHEVTRFGGTRIAEKMPLHYHSIEDAVTNAAPFYKEWKV